MKNDRFDKALRRHLVRAQELVDRIGDLEESLDPQLGLVNPAPLQSTTLGVEAIHQRLLEDVPQRLRDLRQLRGLRQADLAVRTGIARPNIARLEAKGRLPSLATLLCLASALGVGLNELMLTPAKPTGSR
jgi:DNA-binding XRE family transcriptional regulator